MLNKHEGNLLLVSALVCIPMLLLQGVLLAPPASPLTLLLVLMTTLTGFALLLFLTHSVRRGEKARQEQRWLLALQYFPENGDKPEDFDARRCRELVARGAGRPDLKAELVGHVS